nr:recombinase family protein [Dyadobacter fermentans]
MKDQISLTKRVALYARVSTMDRGQNPEIQLTQLREYAQRPNFEVTLVCSILYTLRTVLMR